MHTMHNSLLLLALLALSSSTAVLAQELRDPTPPKIGEALEPFDESIAESECAGGID